MKHNEIIVIAPKRGRPEFNESGSEPKGPVYDK